MSLRTKEAASLGPAAGTIHQTRDYCESAYVSRPNLLEQAGEVGCLLSFCPLSVTGRAGFFALLDRWLCRVYAGGR
jgi:hypothetical protein